MTQHKLRMGTGNSRAGMKPKGPGGTVNLVNVVIIAVYWAWWLLLHMASAMYVPAICGPAIML